MFISVQTANEATVAAYVDSCPDEHHKCIGVKIGGDTTKLDTVSARSLIVGLETIVLEVENRNDELEN